MPVRKLPDELVNRIRAGEVVERPAQVVKELVENALDGGARSIRVALREGGKATIRVEDDGVGMTAEDLTLAVERHATSKLDHGDLFRIDTLGFRGEALAAIGAAARLRIATCVDGAGHGWEIAVDNGAKGAPRPCPRRRGTIVEVRDLFVAHPARAAFLRGTAHEQALCKGVVEALALARPDVAFTLEADSGRKLLSLPAQDFQGRTAAVMGQGFAANSVRFSASAGGMSVRGAIGLPTWQGHAAAGQRLLVNGRPVRDRVVSSALRAALASASKERAPAAVVDLALPPGSVDYNRHPTKAEVKFLDEAAVHALVKGAVGAALGAAGPLAATALGAVAAVLASAPCDRLEDEEAAPLGRPLGMVFGRYVVAVAKDALVLVDAHAAHERIVREGLAAAIADGVAARPLPAPVTVTVGAHAAAVVGERAEALARFGLAVRDAGDGRVEASSVPSLLGDVDAAALVAEVAAVLAEDPHADPLRDRLDALCSAIACHSAIRSGDEVSEGAVRALLRSLERTPAAAQCPHGRPTVLYMDRARLDAAFGRE